MTTFLTSFYPWLLRRAERDDLDRVFDGANVGQRIHLRPGAAPVTIMGSDQYGHSVPAWWLKGEES